MNQTAGGAPIGLFVLIAVVAVVIAVAVVWYRRRR